ncbi:hypothetical protein D6D28_03858 [Aureobasidium pullulans]|uniref:RanBD1 domain-containing protein n=1 Tax=Aureobasidium pullulans TaxID=5580 RepID=A0A4S8SNX0_AURPU|nr:hypothetical protein D6D28_03858 [Aureobasidium pullulans]
MSANMAVEDEVVFGKISTADMELLEEIIGQAKSTVSGAVVHAHQIERLKTMISNLKPTTSSLKPMNQATARNIVVDAPKDLTVLTLVHEARAEVTKYTAMDEKKWVLQGFGTICILVDKNTSRPRIIVRADCSGRVLLNFSIVPCKDLYSIKNERMVLLSVPLEN